MARLIDADEAKRAISENDWSNPCVPTVVGMILDRITTIEAEPVIHAVWEKDGWRCECSNCSAFANSGQARVWKYCPHCGAKMDGKEDA